MISLQKAKLMVGQYDWFWNIMKTLSKIVQVLLFTAHMDALHAVDVFGTKTSLEKTFCGDDVFR